MVNNCDPTLMIARSILFKIRPKNNKFEIYLETIETETYLWTSWTRVRGPEKRVMRYKVSCKSMSVVMKSLQLNVLCNETKNCTKELCIGKYSKFL